MGLFLNQLSKKPNVDFLIIYNIELCERVKTALDMKVLGYGPEMGNQKFCSEIYKKSLLHS